MRNLILIGLLGLTVVACENKNAEDVASRADAGIEAIEGDLPSRLADGSLRLLRVAWLLEQPEDWVLKRRQDLPDEAFWSPSEAARLLVEEKMAKRNAVCPSAQNSKTESQSTPKRSKRCR